MFPRFLMPFRPYLRLILAVSCVVLLAGLAAWSYSRRAVHRTFLVGLDNFPPYTTLNPNGTFSGLNVDVLNEAARRAGVTLKWVPVRVGGPDKALAERVVDLWPSVAITAERRRHIHLTRPWNQSSYCLLSRKESKLGADSKLAGRAIAYPTFPLATRMAHSLFASAVLLPRKGAGEVIAAVCRGEVDAGFLDARNLDPVLMERPAECESTALSIHFVSGAVSDAGIASTPEAAAAADALRSQITTMTTDGTLSRMMDKWTSFSIGEARSLSALQQTEKRAEITLFGLVGLVVVAGVLFWQFQVARKLRQVADRAKSLELDRNTILENLATKESLCSLVEISKMVERHCPQVVCTIATREDDFLVLSSPSRLPQSLVHSLMNVKIGPSDVTSAAAAFHEKLVISDDLGSEAGWTSRSFHLQTSGFRSCWAIPVFSGSHQVIAVLAAYVKASSHPNGQQLCLLESAAQLTGVVLERRRLDEQLQHTATHDSLTALPNRLLLSDQLEQALTRSRETGQHFALLCLDLDRFKRINDTLGHSAGDLFLRKISGLIHSVLGSGDVLARMGGDEFTILLPNAATLEAAEEVAQRLVDIIHSPILVNGIHLFGSASIGIAVYPQHGTTTEDLQRNADSAMYEAKESGKDRYRVFAWEMSQTARGTLAMERDLRIALNSRHFELHYQPQFSAAGQLVGAEALIRFRHPESGLIAPGQFIRCAEECGLIVPIGQWVLHEACRQLGEWQRMGLRAVRIAINISAMQLSQPDFSDTVYSALMAHGVSPELLEIELTESAVMVGIEESTSQLNLLKALGVRLAIDDFGTGYSSLSYLQKLPVDVVKIDRSFVQERQQSGRGIPLVQAIVAASHSLGLEVVAEGVETGSQHRAVCAAGCDIIQGFLLSKPLPASEMEAFLGANAKPFLAVDRHPESAAA